MQRVSALWAATMENTSGSIENELFGSWNSFDIKKSLLYHRKYNKEGKLRLFQGFTFMRCYKWLFLSFWDDFNPVIIRVIDKINPHFRIFKTNATHFFVFFISGIIVLCFQSKMELIFP